MTPQNLCGNIQPVIRVCLTISYRDRCPQGLNREVRCNAGAVPPLYWGANPSYTTGMKILGRFGRAMIQSQENCLFDNHRFYPRAMGRGFLHSSCVELLPGIFLPGFFIKMLPAVQNSSHTRELFFFLCVPPISRHFSFWRGFISRRLFCRGASR